MTALDPAPQNTVTVRGYLQLLWRRKWLVLAAVIVAPAIAYVFTARQATHYVATAEVLLLNPVTAISPAATPAFSQPVIPNTADTQTALARSTPVASLAVSIGHLGIAPGTLLGETNVGFSPSGDIVYFTATSQDAASAPRIANAYAAAYVRYRYTSETSGLRAEEKTLEAGLKATPHGAARAAIAGDTS